MSRNIIDFPQLKQYNINVYLFTDPLSVPSARPRESKSAGPNQKKRSERHMDIKQENFVLH
ncbi:MAG: hypothetical protein IIZ45_06915, partial [Firmicutes bacterium]|nr:hypothetical protein [Bacillota bacterium]